MELFPDLEHWRCATASKTFNGFKCELAIGSGFSTFNAQAFFDMVYNIVCTAKPATAGLANFNQAFSNR
jgi:hypothetical protein